MLRMVPLPRVAGEEQCVNRRVTLRRCPGRSRSGTPGALLDIDRVQCAAGRGRQSRRALDLNCSRHSARVRDFLSLYRANALGRDGHDRYGLAGQSDKFDLVSGAPSWTMTTQPTSPGWKPCSGRALVSTAGSNFLGSSACGLENCFIRYYMLKSYHLLEQVRKRWRTVWRNMSGL
jgi:hypothetical protein